MTKQPPPIRQGTNFKHFDFTVTEYRSGLCLLYPWSSAADTWVAEAQATCGFSSFGDGLCIDVKHIELVLDHIKERGLRVEGEIEK